MMSREVADMTMMKVDEKSQPSADTGMSCRQYADVTFDFLV